MRSGLTYAVGGVVGEVVAAEARASVRFGCVRRVDADVRTATVVDGTVDIRN